MNNISGSIFCLLVMQFLLPSFIHPSEKQLNDFSLKSTDGKNVSLKDFPDAKGFIIVFTCNHCPFAKLYPARLNNLNEKYKSQNVPLIAISSTDPVIHEEDTFEEMIRYAKDKNFRFPYLFDETQSVAKNFGADKTPHAFIIWKENEQWKIKYNGSIDDNGGEPDQVIHKYVEDAVDLLLAGKKVMITETKSIGCTIRFRNTVN